MPASAATGRISRRQPSRPEHATVPSDPRAGRRGHPSGVRSGVLLLVPVLAAALLLMVPLVFLVRRAATDTGLSGMRSIVASAAFQDALQRTLLLSVVVTVACAVLGTVYAIAIAATNRWLSTLLLASLLSAFWVSLLVRTFGWVILFQPNGALDQALEGLGLTSGSLELLQTTKAMYPAMIHVLLPYFFLPVFAAVRQLDADRIRAAQSLGAKAPAVLWHVVLPGLRPAIVSAACLTFMLALSFYVTPLLLGGPSQMTVATLVDREFSQRYDLGAACSIGLILLGIVMTLYLLVDRFVDIIPKRVS